MEFQSPLATAPFQAALKSNGLNLSVCPIGETWRRIRARCADASAGVEGFFPIFSDMDTEGMMRFQERHRAESGAGSQGGLVRTELGIRAMPGAGFGDLRQAYSKHQH